MMKPRMFSTEDLIRNQEAVFAILMGLIAFLSRNSPDMQYPQVLWAFGVFFTFNLAYHRLLIHYGKEWVVSFVSIAVNCLIITFVLSASGGSDSYFWPMYLLPIFTACLYLSERHIAFAVMIPAAFLGYFYLEYLYNYEGWKLIEMVIKWAVLTLAAGVTMRESFKQRKAVEALQHSQLELDRLASSQREEPRSGSGAAQGSVTEVLSKLIQDMYMSLSVIWASAQILLQDAEPGAPSTLDLNRIKTEILSCYDLMAYSKKWVHSDRKMEKVDLSHLFDRLFTLIEYQVARKNLTWIRKVDNHLPVLHMSQESVFQGLFGIFLSMVEVADIGSTVSMKVQKGGDGVNLDFFCQDPLPGVPFKNFESCQKLLLIQGASMSIVTDGGTVKCSICLPVKPSQETHSRVRSR